MTENMGKRPSGHRKTEKSGDRLAAGETLFPRRWYGDMISANLEVIWEMSIKVLASRFGPFLLFASWPFISLWDHNKNEAADFDRLLFIAIIVIATGLALTGIIGLIFRRTEIERIALTVGLATSAFFSFQVAVSIVQYFSGSRNIYYLIVWGIAFAVAIAAGLYLGKDRATRRLAAVMGTVLVTIPLVSLVGHYLHEKNSFEVVGRGDTDNERLSALNTAALPSIYYFILDAYARGDVLKKYFSFDNSPFLQGLRDKGFYVVENSYSNYPSTLYSISTTLNMDYFLPVGLNSERNLNKKSPIFKSLKGGDSVVLNRLRAMGYTYYYANHKGNLGTSCEPFCITGKASWTRFEFILLQMTPAYPILDKWYNDIIRKWGFFYQKNLEPVIDRLGSLRPRPVYLYAHILSPHPPFVYKPDCSERLRVELKMTVDDSVTKTEVAKRHYVEEIVCLNSRMNEAIRRILQTDPNAIIIVQSDHGLKPPGTIDKRDSRTANIISANLSALKLPERCADSLYKSMTAVNTFRVVLACIEGTTPNLVSDRIFNINEGSFIETRQIP